ncbi:LysR substrate-binding domain-containing protein [Herbaspirillum sp. WKF16]|uniref:LysR family transcriptional regulator n=1 Tax=Herbaspirillum sp. WKF16 TaxID=3028312 RepID=UPI0023A9B2C1|nr:LysR family transcriptional regulator [Herbaspirillum sp. WKF16]WDZ94912.1 LysR substrate-binding domain-containing protein [Herbaspirillum sp. WKF16]
MNLASVDPKLLFLLNAVFDEVHLARAAARVGLPLPAAASALERCRQLFQDPLLEDGGQAMRLTSAAQALRQPLRLALAAAGHGRPEREAGVAGIAQRVRLLMADYPAQAVAQPLYAELAASAPRLDLEFQPWRSNADAALRLERGEVDLVIGSPAPLHGPIYSREVLQERCVAVMRHDHPAAQQLTLQKWLAYPQLRVSSHDTLNRMLDEQLAAQGLALRIGVSVPNFLMAAPLLQASDLIALMPMHCVPAATAAHPVPLGCLRPPLPVAGLSLHLLRHQRSDDDIAVVHVAQALERVVRRHVAGR